MNELHVWSSRHYKTYLTAHNYILRDASTHLFIVRDKDRQLTSNDDNIVWDAQKKCDKLTTIDNYNYYYYCTFDKTQTAPTTEHSFRCIFYEEDEFL